jgi:hypothetical protein
LYQGTASAVPQKTHKGSAFRPCVRFLRFSEPRSIHHTLLGAGSFSGKSPDFSQLAALVLAIAKKNMRALLHFFPSGFATIEVEERIDVQTQAKPRRQEQFAFVLNTSGTLNGPFGPFTFAE